MRIAVTADLHWGHNRVGDAATVALVDFLRGQSPDVLLLGGDQGTQEHFAECLQLFAEFCCPKALVPGNHDLWVAETDARGDSLAVYQNHLPRVCREQGFHYLDAGPLILSRGGLAIAGSINWYDYSWSLGRLQSEVPDWQWRVRNKVFSRGRHNDARFIRWPLDDAGFTGLVVSQLQRHLEAGLQQVDKALVLTHHPACYALNFPRTEPPQSMDGLLWDALSGNRSLEELLRHHADRLALVLSGHTHRARRESWENVPAYNIGGDYHFKRLLIIDWPGAQVACHTFGDTERR